MMNNNYVESAKYLKYAFELNHGGDYDDLQFYIGSSLLKKIVDAELSAYMENSNRSKSTNWKLELILKHLTDNISL